MRNNEPIIIEIGIEICLNCPYYNEDDPDSECISSDTELCHVLKDEVKRIKNETQAEQDRVDREMVSNIRASIKTSIKNGGLTIPELRDIHGYKYNDIVSLIRRGRLKSRKEKEGQCTKIIVIS
jgi:hypothetical protein